MGRGKAYRKNLNANKNEGQDEGEESTAQTDNSSYKYKCFEDAVVRYRAGAGLKQFYDCRECGHTYSKSDKMHVHFKEKHPGLLYGNRCCPFDCRFIGYNTVALKNHLKTKHEGQEIPAEGTVQRTLFQCPDPLCSRSFTREAYVQAHYKQEHESVVWDANNCAVLKITDKTTGEVKEYPVTKAVGSDAKIHCGHCERSFSFLKQVISHLEKGEKTHECEDCGRPFSQRQILYKHIEDEHAEVIQAPVQGQDQPISVEGQGQADHAQESAAAVKAPAPRKFRCKKCGCPAFFSTSALLRKHTKSIGVHEGLKCSGVFESRDEIRAHLEDEHPGETNVKFRFPFQEDEEPMNDEVQELDENEGHGQEDSFQGQGQHEDSLGQVHILQENLPQVDLESDQPQRKRKRKQNWDFM